MIRCVFLILLALGLSVLPALALQPPSPPTGFVQVTEVPPSEQLPASPLLIGAYAFFLVLMVSYNWSVGRWLNKVEKEMATLRRGSSRSGSS